MKRKKLWAILVPGSWEYFPASSKAEAKRDQRRHNSWLAEWYVRQKECSSRLLPEEKSCRARVVRWPFGRKAYARAMSDMADMRRCGEL